ncbi:shugoshin 2 [Spea bombifrons]|uniref:shugoshin 2 n=1 Tax=Spea bombifrons TaxID=233779 RepID=UPI002349588C|nr:shugoshin 2 [Spea bombifrons]
MDLQSSASLPALQTMKDRMREKINGSLKAAKLSTSLAAKIKNKTLNNSSILKISLKHNNKALAYALTLERQKSRSLENDKMFLQKEVKMLHFQNALLRQNLNIVNKILKDIDLFMDIQLPTAIEISNNAESLDLESDERRSKRLSHQSRFSSDGGQGFRLTGVALRVPSTSVGDWKQENRVSLSLGTENATNNVCSLQPSAKRGTSQGAEINNTSAVTSTECLASNEAANSDGASSLNNWELSNAFAESCSSKDMSAFVTKRRKRSTVSRSSTQSVKSDCSQRRCTNGSGRESSASSQWEQAADIAVRPDLTYSEAGAVTGAPQDDYTQSCDIDRKRNSRSTVRYSGSQSLTMDYEESRDPNSENRLHTQHERVPDKVPSTDRVERHPGLVNAEPEKTVYAADMEMTTSDAAAIVAVSSKNKAQISKDKSTVPSKCDGTLRKVKHSAREKAKSKSSLKTVPCVTEEATKATMKEESGFDSNIKVTRVQDGQMTLQPTTKTYLDTQLSKKFEGHKTRVLTQPIKQEQHSFFVNEVDADIIMENTNFSDTIVASLTSANEMFALGPDQMETYPAPEERPLKRVRYDSSKQRKLNTATKVCDVESSKKKKCKKQKPKIDPREHEKNIIQGKLDMVPKETVDEVKDLKKMENLSGIALCNLASRETQIRRETYVVDATGINRSPAPQPASKGNGFHSRRETYVVNPSDAHHLSAAQPVFRENKFSCRRETYVVDPFEAYHPSAAQPLSREDRFSCRRETYVIPESAPAALSIQKDAQGSEKKNVNNPVLSCGPALSTSDLLVGPDPSQENKKSVHARKYKRDTEPFFAFAEGSQTLTNGSLQNEISGFSHSTFIMREDKQELSDCLGNENVTLVQETMTDLLFNQPKKITDPLAFYMSNEQESFMLDMVSESVLETMLESPSFLQVSSITNNENTSLATDRSLLLNIPLVELPASEEPSRLPENSSSLDETIENQPKDASEGEMNLHCKDLDQTSDHQETGKYRALNIDYNNVPRLLKLT